MTASIMPSSHALGNRSEGTWTIPFVGSISAAFGRYLEYRRSVDEMNACSDRVLKDLGIYRGDIRRLAREATYGVEPS